MYKKLFLLSLLSVPAVGVGADLGAIVERMREKEESAEISKYLLSLQTNLQELRNLKVELAAEIEATELEVKKIEREVHALAALEANADDSLLRWRGRKLAEELNGDGL